MRLHTFRPPAWDGGLPRRAPPALDRPSRGVPWAMHKRSTGVPQAFHRRPPRSTGLPRAFHGRCTSVPQAFHRRSTSVPQAFRGRSTSVPQACRKLENSAVPVVSLKLSGHVPQTPYNYSALLAQDLAHTGTCTNWCQEVVLKDVPTALGNHCVRLATTLAKHICFCATLCYDVLANLLQVVRLASTGIRQWKAKMGKTVRPKTPKVPTGGKSPQHTAPQTPIFQCYGIVSWGGQ